jgi:hypothetical protein
MAGALVGCGGGEATPIVATPAAPKPRNAADIAMSIVGGKVGALLYGERVRGRPIAQKIAALGLWQSALEGTGVDPERDLDRAFIGAPAANREEATIVVAEHHLTPERAQQAINVMIGKSAPPGAWISPPTPGSPLSMARVNVRGRARIVALVDTNFLVVVPEPYANQLSRFVGTGGFPDPEGPESVVAQALEPASTVVIAQAPSLPPSIHIARAALTFGSDGSADVAFDGASESDGQAVNDAAYMTRAMDEATSVQVAFVKLRFMEPIPFHAEGAHVKGATHLTPTDVDRLFTAAAALIPR